MLSLRSRIGILSRSLRPSPHCCTGTSCWYSTTSGSEERKKRKQQRKEQQLQKLEELRSIIEADISSLSTAGSQPAATAQKTTGGAFDLGSARWHVVQLAKTNMAVDSVQEKRNLTRLLKFYETLKAKVSTEKILMRSASDYVTDCDLPFHFSYEMDFRGRCKVVRRLNTSAPVAFVKMVPNKCVYEWLSSEVYKCRCSFASEEIIRYFFEKSICSSAWNDVLLRSRVKELNSPFAVEGLKKMLEGELQHTLSTEGIAEFLDKELELRERFSKS